MERKISTARSAKEMAYRGRGRRQGAAQGIRGDDSSNSDAMLSAPLFSWCSSGEQYQRKRGFGVRYEGSR